MVGTFESITTVNHIRGGKPFIGHHPRANYGNAIIGIASLSARRDAWPCVSTIRPIPYPADQDLQP